MHLGCFYVPDSIDTSFPPLILWINPKSNMSVFPIWQVSFNHGPSNGSLHRNQVGREPLIWWMDMNIDMQRTCEQALGTSQDIIHLEFKGVDYLISFSNMTQLNLKMGSLRRIRRRLLLHLM